MDDSQSPPDADSRAGSHKGDPARLSSVGLGDAEEGAATQHDLLAPGEEESQAAAASEPAGWGPAAQESVNDGAPHIHAAEAPDSSNLPEAAPEPEQSLDAFIDSIPVDPPSPPEEQGPPKPAADTGFRDAPERYQVSAIFEGLSSRHQHAEETGSAERPPEANDADSDAATIAADASEAADEPVTQRTQPAGAASGFNVPLFSKPVASAPMPEPPDWSPHEAPAGNDAGGDAQADDQADEQPPSAAHSRGVEPFPEPLGWPPFPESPDSETTDAAVEPLKPPSLVTGELDAPGSPFPAPPAWPPSSDSPGGDSGPSAQGSSGLPPYIELPAHPDMEEQTASGPADLAGSSVRGETPRFAGPPGMLPPAFDDLTTAPAAWDPREMPRFHRMEADEPVAVEPPSKTSAAVSAKIEAEANATAQALDNLQRLLSKTAAPGAPPSSQVPPQQPFRPQAAPHRPHNQLFQLPQDDDRFVPEMTPMPLPGLPTEEASDRRVYVLGFLTGLVLSVMAGAALYFLINFG